MWFKVCTFYLENVNYNLRILPKQLKKSNVWTSVTHIFFVIQSSVLCLPRLMRNKSLLVDHLASFNGIFLWLRIEFIIMCTSGPSVHCAQSCQNMLVSTSEQCSHCDSNDTKGSGDGRSVEGCHWGPGGAGPIAEECVAASNADRAYPTWDTEGLVTSRGDETGGEGSTTLPIGHTILTHNHLLLAGVLNVCCTVDYKLRIWAFIVQQSLFTVVTLHLRGPDWAEHASP